MKIKIAHFLGTMRPGHDGVTRVAYRMRELFKPEDAQHIFISPILPEDVPTDMRGVRSVPFPLSTDYRLAMCTSESIRTVLGSDVPDVVHIHSPCTLGRAAVKYATVEGIPAVATYHTHFPTYLTYYKVNFLKPLVWKYMRSLYGACEAVIVPSKATLSDLRRQGLKNLLHIPHGVDTRSFSPKHRSQEWRHSVGGDDKVVASFVGRLVWEKNLMLLAESYPLMKQRNRVKIVIVGDGPARPKLEELMPEAHFTGFLGEKELPIAYASSDIFVFPSVTETFGNVTVEAMASGLPAICANAGGACDIVEPNVNGLLVSAENPKDLAHALDTLVARPEVRRRMVKAALKTVENYQWTRTVARYEELYREVTKEKKGSKRTKPKGLDRDANSQLERTRTS